LVDVRLLLGPHLIAQALVAEPRPDVATHLGLEGNFGFRLTIPETPCPFPDADHPRVVALSGDGSVHVDLPLISRKGSLQTLLQAALHQELRGLQGHLDGLTSDGEALHGWCIRHGSTLPARVWLQAEGLEPFEMVCNNERPGMSLNGLPDASGFLVVAVDRPELVGRSLGVSYDKEGLLPLPSSCQLPVCLNPRISGSHSMVQFPESSTPVAVESGQMLSMAPSSDLQDYWDQLEEFRLLLDQIESGIEQARQADQLASLLTSRRRRSARFRLWR
jgi:hypothetical protein